MDENKNALRGADLTKAKFGNPSLIVDIELLNEVQLFGVLDSLNNKKSFTKKDCEDLELVIKRLKRFGVVVQLATYLQIIKNVSKVLKNQG